MKYLGYILILLAGLFGFGQMRPFTLVALALISTFFFARRRRSSVKHDRTPPGALMDGLFLFSAQLLIMFTAYIIGYFLANAAHTLPSF